MANAPATDLAPTDTTTGAEDAPDTSLIDVKPDAKPAGTTTDTPVDASPKPANSDKPSTDAKPEGDKPTGDKPVQAAVPEKYADPKLPDGYILNSEAKGRFDAIAKELGMSQEAYQKVFDVYGEQLKADVKTKMDQFNQTISAWKEETQKELGTTMTKELSLASKGIDAVFKNAEENKVFREMMSESATGLGNWKLMVKAFSFIGKAISEDAFVEGRSGQGQQKSTAEIIYDHPTSIAARSQEAVG